MKIFSALLVSASLLTITACGGDDEKQDDPAPVSGEANVEIRLTNVGKTGGDCSSFLLNRSIYAADKSGLVRHWSKDLEAGTTKYTVGKLSRGATYYFSVVYDTGGAPNYVRPTAGQYIEGEIFADGKSLGTVRADANTFNDPSKYWGFDDTDKGLRVGSEVTVKL